MSWKNDLEREIKDVLEEPSRNRREPMSRISFDDRRPAAVSNSGSGNQMTIGLVLFVLLLGVGLVFAWNSKRNQQPQGYPPLASAPPGWSVKPNPGMGQPQPYPPFQQPPFQQPGGNPQVEQDVATLKQVTQLMWQTTKENQEKLTLLGVLSNQNFTVMQKNYPKSDMVFLNGDWTINKLPNHLYLDSEDRAFLERYLRKGE